MLLPLENQEYVVKNIPKYNLTKGINEKKYRIISEQVINNIFPNWRLVRQRFY